MSRKKKIIIITVLLLLLFIIAMPAFLFTPLGNAVIAPFVENKINSLIPVKIELDAFRLTPSQIHLKGTLSETSYVTADGTYGLFDKSFDINYKVHITDLAEFADMIKQDIRGPLDTEGNAKGTSEHLTVHGKSDIADSDTIYDVTVIDSNVKNIATTIKHLNLQKILYMLRRPEIIDGGLNANLNFTDLNPKNLKGSITAELTDGQINSDEILQLFDLSLPKTKAVFNVDADFNGGDIKYIINLVSEPATIRSEGLCSKDSNSIDITYFIDIKELAMFASILKKDYRGALKTIGSLKGRPDKFVAEGTGDVAEGTLSYRVPITNQMPQSANFALQGVHLSKLLYMLKQPIYTDALVNIDGTFDSLEKDNISGHILTVIADGKTFPGILREQFDLKDADIKYNGKIESEISENVATNNVRINSDAANLTAKNLVYNLNNHLLKSDFVVDIPNLDNLYFATGRHLKGAMMFTGNIQKDKDLLLNAHSDAFGGQIEITMKNNDLHNHFEIVKVSDILETFIYPIFFESPLSGDLFYNIKTKKGTFKGKLRDGRFLKNTMTDVVAKTTKLDMTKEVYETTSIDAKIADHIIKGDLSMSSGNTEISAKSAVIDMEKEQINVKLQINPKDNPVTVILTGDITHPNIRIEAKELIKTKLNTIIEKKAPKKTKKLLKDLLKML